MRSCVHDERKNAPFLEWKLMCDKWCFDGNSNVVLIFLCVSYFSSNELYAPSLPPFLCTPLCFSWSVYKQIFDCS